MALVLQDIVLNQARRDKIAVEVLLCNGDKIQGYIRGFDSFTIIIDKDEKTQMMVYKYNVVSITPKNPVLVDTYNNENGI
ncbi:MAG: RNA chaperone Hfq [Firmicutes bacterium]|nr:RNA chaperone Hfq [Bacillota bacterium]